MWFAFVAGQPLELLHINTVTLAEIRFGIEPLRRPRAPLSAHGLADSQGRPMFEQRVLAVTVDIMFKWRLMVEEDRKSGHTFSLPDLIIAATGQYQGLTVVSRDTVQSLG